MEEKTQNRKTILSVDDSRALRLLLHEAVSVLGYESRTAKDGIDALKKLTESTFDVVITDIDMPRMDGLELIHRIASDYPEVDVIALTGYPTVYKYTDVIEVGASDFIIKPFSVNELEAKIKRIIRERTLRFELQRLSTKDGLTGLFNRRNFDESLKHEAVRALRQNYGLYLVLIDVDRFKGYNDKYGHPKGDDLLKELAKVIFRNIRQDVDSGYRYGGDEFAVLIPHAERQQALMVAHRLLASYNERDLSPTSLSIGVAKLKDCRDSLEENLEDLVRMADRDLYVAKSGGGNQVCEEGGRIDPVNAFPTPLEVKPERSD